MSNLTNDSSGSSKGSHRVKGIPRRCWCGASAVVKMSKSEANPYRRFYRCAFAASHKLVDDTHVFKWFDDAVVNEIETMSNSLARLEVEMKEMTSYIEDLQKKAMEKAEAEAETLKKVEEMIEEAKWRMKCAIFLLGVVCMVSVWIMRMVS